MYDFISIVAFNILVYPCYMVKYILNEYLNISFHSESTNLTIVSSNSFSIRAKNANTFNWYNKKVFHPVDKYSSNT